MELVNVIVPNISQALEHLSTKIWNKEEITEEWKCALTHPLHRKCDKMNVNSCREVSLLPVAYKIWQKMLLQFIENVSLPILKNETGEY